MLRKRKGVLFVGALLVAGAILSSTVFAVTSGSGSVTVSASGGAIGSVGNVAFLSSSQTSTTLTNGATSSVVEVNRTTGFSAGDAVKIGSDYYAVQSVDSTGKTLTLDRALSTSTNASVTEATGYTSSNSNPSWTPVNNSGSTIAPGGLYTVDLTGDRGNVMLSLYLTNPDKLQSAYSYFFQHVNVYALCGAGDAATTTACHRGSVPFAADGAINSGGAAPESTSTTATVGTWIQAANAFGRDQSSNGIDSSPSYLSLSSGTFNVVLKGGFVYNIVVDGGSTYTIDSSGTLSPSYFVQLTPA